MVLFATAYALHATMRKNFKTICFEQSLMRQHLLECLQNEALTDFSAVDVPSAKPGRSKVSHIEINLFCTFRMPESFDSKMIECDQCADCFHFKCVGLKKNTTPAKWHSYQPSRFLLEYPAKTPLIPLSRISTSNSHILG